MGVGQGPQRVQMAVTASSSSRPSRSRSDAPDRSSVPFGPKNVLILDQRVASHVGFWLLSEH